MAEIWFDTRTGDQLIGKHAPELCQTEPGPEGLVPLRELLTQVDFPFNAGDFERDDEWDRERMLNIGRMVIGVLAEDTDESPRLHREHMSRLRILGLGPSIPAIRKEFGAYFWQYLEELEVQPTRAYYRFDDWSREDFIKFAAELAQHLERPPTYDDYTNAAHGKQQPGPIPWIIRQRIGTTSQLNELIGYPNINVWDRKDYLRWGSKVMAANHNRRMTARLISILSSRYRGPSVTTLRNHFTRLADFQSEVSFFRRDEIIHEAIRREQISTRYTKLVKGRRLERPFMPPTFEQQCAAIAKLAVVNRLLPTVSTRISRALATRNSENFAAEILRFNRTLNKEIIEKTAMALNCYDDIWPPSQDWKRYLRVTDQELGYKRKANQERFRSSD
jgi:hypothetical protein